MLEVPITVVIIVLLYNLIFCDFQSFSNLQEKPLLVDLTVEEGQRLKVVYGSNHGFHAIDLDTSQVFDIYNPQHVSTDLRDCYMYSYLQRYAEMSVKHSNRCER